MPLVEAHMNADATEDEAVEAMHINGRGGTAPGGSKGLSIPDRVALLVTKP